MGMEQKNTNPIDIKVNKIIETCKRSMKMYRITRVQGEVVYLEHFYSKSPISISLSDLLKNIRENSGNPWIDMTITNPSALNNKLKNMPKEKRDSFLYDNSSVYSIPDFENSDKISVISNQNRSSISFTIHELLLELKQGRCLCFSNPMALEPYLNYYLANFEKDNIFKFIAKSLLDTFIDYNVETSGEITDSSFRFRLSETDNKSEQATTIYLKRQDNTITIAGKRNNMKLDLSYSIRNIGQNQGRLNKLIYKMHIDICLGLKLTPFRFLTSYPYLNEEAKKTMADSENMFYIAINKKSFERTKIITENGKSISEARMELGFIVKPEFSSKTIVLKRATYIFRLDFDLGEIKWSLDSLYDTWNSNTDLARTAKTGEKILNYNIKGSDGFRGVVGPYKPMNDIAEQNNTLNVKVLKEIRNITDEEVLNILLIGYKQKDSKTFIYTLRNKHGYVLLESLGNHKYATTIYYGNEILQKRGEFALDFNKNPNTELAVKKSYINTAVGNLNYYDDK